MQVQGASWLTLWDTLPRISPLSPPRPRLPMTMQSARVSFAASRIAFAGSPSRTLVVILVPAAPRVATSLNVVNAPIVLAVCGASVSARILWVVREIDWKGGPDGAVQAGDSEAWDATRRRPR